MKKITKLLLSLSLLFVNAAIPVNAAEKNIEEIFTYALETEFSHLLNEIEKFESKSILRLKSDEYKEYNDLLNAKEEYKKFLYAQKELSVDKLKEQNYTDEQIKALKSFDGSDEIAARASAYVYATASTISKTTSLHGVRFNWEWVGTPAFSGLGMMDGIAVRWQSCDQYGHIVDASKHSSTNAYVMYGNRKIPITEIIYYSTANAIEVDFSLVELDGEEIEIVDSGQIDVYISRPLSTSTYLAHTDFEFSYAHSTIFIGNISFSFPSGDASITVEDGVEETQMNWEVYV